MLLTPGGATAFRRLWENLFTNLANDSICLRFNIFGPNQKDHFIRVYERLKNGTARIIGDDTRAFCYIDDAVDMVQTTRKAKFGTKRLTLETTKSGKLLMLHDYATNELRYENLEVQPSPFGISKMPRYQ